MNLSVAEKEWKKWGKWQRLWAFDIFASIIAAFVSAMGGNIAWTIFWMSLFAICLRIHNII